ncbi:helix-turn-helix transcriptional regulator [bacterium]|nr:helix-turn-helix transcriptional regulator [bacterium]
MLRKIRLNRDLSITKLSELSGVSRSLICEYEHNKKSLSISTLYRLARALQVQPGDLLQPIDFDSDFSTPPFDHNVPDQCPFAVDERPSSCSECPNSGSCPFFTYEEEEDV